MLQCHCPYQDGQELGLQTLTQQRTLNSSNDNSTLIHMLSLWYEHLYISLERSLYVMSGPDDSRTHSWEEANWSNIGSCQVE